MGSKKKPKESPSILRSVWIPGPHGQRDGGRGLFLTIVPPFDDCPDESKTLRVRLTSQNGTVSADFDLADFRDAVKDLK